MELAQLHLDFAVCKLQSIDHVDFNDAFVFLSKTDDEISLVCPLESIPEDATDIERGWKGLKISGVLDFGMIGVIARIANILVAEKISLFAVSTYNTDYIFLKSNFYPEALKALSANGYTIV